MSKIILAEQSSAPDTPGSGKVAIFVDTNGDLAWKDDAGNVIKIASAGAYTLTIPATGTAALRDVAQTFSAQQTFDQAPIAPGMKPAADSTTALQLQKSNGTAVLTVDTTNSIVYPTKIIQEEGTWTPTIKAGGGNTGMTFYVQIGRYVRLGNWVGLSFVVSVNAKGSSTGALTLEGLPFTIANITNYNPPVNAVYDRWTLTAGYKAAALGIYNTTKANIYQIAQADSGSLSQLSDANLPGGIYGSMWYLAA